MSISCQMMYVPNRGMEGIVLATCRGITMTSMKGCVVLLTIADVEETSTDSLPHTNVRFVV